ncbi:MAG: hypothetical protein U9N62_13525 [Thermotogota bacterium]|nr:hypothetical protein [Thermotogota bacterium]
MENKKSINAQWKKGIRKMLKRTESTKYKTSHGRIAGQLHKTSVSFCENFTLLVDASGKVTDAQFKRVFV